MGESMYIEQFVEVLNGFAPLELSRKRIEMGDYDNSGLIVKGKNTVEKTLFSLDLSVVAVQKAVRLKCDTVVTHHPAIYRPISRLSGEDGVSIAAANRLNVISMHLNLDFANGGTDEWLATALGARADECELLDVMDGGGYGRQFAVEDMTFGEFVLRAKNELRTRRVIAYGSPKDRVSVCAGFSGAGAGVAERALDEGRLVADTVVTSDAAHHQILKLVENGKKLLLIPHYAAENFGFTKFYQSVKERVAGQIECINFTDKRFM